jgi:hypothetical protein
MRQTDPDALARLLREMAEVRALLGRLERLVLDGREAADRIKDAVECSAAPRRPEGWRPNSAAAEVCGGKADQPTWPTQAGKNTTASVRPALPTALAMTSGPSKTAASPAVLGGEATPPPLPSVAGVLS